MTRLQLVLRWVWLLIGVLLLGLLVAAVVFVVRESAGGGGGGAASKADSARDAQARARKAEPLRYGPPQAIAGSPARIVLIRRGSGYRYSSTALSSASTGQAPMVNVAFLEGSGARLLLDRPAYISEVTFPGSAAGRSMVQADSLRWIVYEMALDDGDGNEKVDEADPRSLYVTDLEGRGLRRVLPPGLELRDWAPQPGGSIVITAVQLTRDAAQMPERAFVLDAAGTVRPYAALDSVVDAAAQIVAKP
ncbi:MAG TPA: hypothetical protein VFJ82_06250 [Longimicrobium sp.]|nr:hypothetical protein [Longimicrobium sp.]